MRSRARQGLSVCLVVFAAVAASCGGDDDSAEDTAAATTALVSTIPPATEPAATDAPSTTMDPGMDMSTTVAPDTTAAAGGMRTTYPLEVTDCGGFTSTFTGPPERTVTMDPQAYELMFWIGKGTEQLAAGPQPLPAVPDQFKADTTKVTVVAEDENDGHSQYISKETLLATDPDFVFGSYGSAFTPPSVYGEDELLAKGINVFYSTGIGGCVGQDGNAPRTDLEAVFDDITTLGQIYDVQDTTEGLVADLRARLADAAATAGPGAGAKVWVMGTDDLSTGTPSYWGVSSSVNAIITLAGGVNIFSDMTEGYGATSYEEIIKRSPDVIMLSAYPADIPQGWDDEEAFLTSQPALAEVPAVKNHRFVRVTFPEVGGGGVRSVDGVEKLAEVLAQLDG